MSRLRGTFIDQNNYEVNAKRPYDARMLVPTYADLTLKDNWLALDPDTNEITTSSVAFNGLIVAVADKNDAEHSGIYMLYDTSSKKTPDVTIETNWIKVGDLQDIESLKEDLEGQISEKATSASTLSGYGIQDAYTKTQVDAMITNLSNINLDGYVSEEEWEERTSSFASYSDIEYLEGEVSSKANTSYVDEQLRATNESVANVVAAITYGTF